MSTMTKLDWNLANSANARIAVSDGVCTHYISDDQLPEEFYLEEIAKDYTRDYDHNDTEDAFAECTIEDLSDGECRRFRFDGHDNFQWDIR